MTWSGLQYIQIKTLFALANVCMSLWIESDSSTIMFLRSEAQEPIQTSLPDAVRDRETWQNTISQQEVPTIQRWPAEVRHKLKPYWEAATARECRGMVNQFLGKGIKARNVWGLYSLKLPDDFYNLWRIMDHYFFIYL